jgi:hypothetical protein
MSVYYINIGEDHTDCKDRPDMQGVDNKKGLSVKNDFMIFNSLRFLFYPCRL